MKTLPLALVLFCAPAAFALQASIKEGPRADVPAVSAPAIGAPTVGVPALQTPAMSVGVDAPALTPALDAELPAGAAASAASQGRDAAAQRVGELSTRVGASVRAAGDLSSASEESAGGLGRDVQSLLEGSRAAASRGDVLAPASAPKMAALAAAPAASSTARRSRFASVAASAAMLVASASPVLARASDAVDPAVSDVLAPATVLGILAGVAISLIIGVVRRGDILSWLQKSMAYVVAFGAVGASIGAIAYMFSIQAANLDMIGVGAGAALSLAVAISRWTNKKLDDAYDALKKSLAFMVTFGFASLVVALLGAIGGAAAANPVAVGIAAGGLSAVFSGGLLRGQDEWAWLHKASMLMLVLGGFGLLIGIGAHMFNPIVSIVTAVGITAGAAIAMGSSVVRAYRKQSQSWDKWLWEAGFRMASLGFLGFVVGAIANIGSVWLAWPTAAGFAIGVSAVSVLSRGELLSINDNEQESWLKKALLMAGFMGAIGFALGGLALLGGFTPFLSATFGGVGAWLPSLPALPALSSIPGAGFVSWLAHGWLMYPLGIGLLIGLLLAVLLGSQQLRQASQRAEWAKKAAQLMGITGGAGFLIGAIALGVKTLFF